MNLFKLLFKSETPDQKALRLESEIEQYTAQSEKETNPQDKIRQQKWVAVLNQQLENVKKLK